MASLAVVVLGALGAPAAQACDLVAAVASSCPPEEEQPPPSGGDAQKPPPGGEPQQPPPGGQGQHQQPPPEQRGEPAPPATVRAAADRLYELVNRERLAAGLPALARRDDVRAMAEEHSMRMAHAGTIWHNEAYFSTENRRRLGARSLGENVALNSDVDDAHRRLMASAGHRANILSPHFTAVGIGVVRDSGGRHFITQGFIETAAAAPAAGTGAQRPHAAPARPAREAPPAARTAHQGKPAPEAAGAVPAGADAATARGAALRLPADPPAAAGSSSRRPAGSASGSAAGAPALAAGMGIAALLASAGMLAARHRHVLAPA